MITSNSNPQIKHIIQLQKKSKYREEQKLFVVEGIKMVLETPDRYLDKVYISESFNPDTAVSKWLKVHSYELVSDKVFKEMTQTQTPQGILASVKMKTYDLKQILKGDSFLILETLQDPGNLGTILRTAEGAGIDGVIMNRTCVDIYNPKVVRSTMGSLYRVPFLYTDDLIGTINQMKKDGVRFFAAHLKGKHNYCEANYKGKTAFMIGNEANGLSDDIAELANEYIKIPMAGKVESLNAAMAAGILMYEARRQKGF